MTAKKQEGPRPRPDRAASPGGRPKGRTLHVRTSQATSEPAAVTDSEAEFGAFLEALAAEGVEDLDDDAPGPV